MAGVKEESGTGRTHMAQTEKELVFIGNVGVGNEKRTRFKIQVADVKKPLMAVKRIVKKGNRVVFAEGVGNSYIVTAKTGDKLVLRENGRGSYLMDVNFVGGGKGEITVDRGAEEDVCPKDWVSRSKINEEVKKLKFRGANGGEIKLYGERDLFVTSEVF